MVTDWSSECLLAVSCGIRCDVVVVSSSWLTRSNVSCCVILRPARGFGRRLKKRSLLHFECESCSGAINGRARSTEAQMKYEGYDSFIIEINMIPMIHSNHHHPEMQRCGVLAWFRVLSIGKLKNTFESDSFIENPYLMPTTRNQKTSVILQNVHREEYAAFRFDTTHEHQ